MTANELKSRYGIKLPHELGKPLYIQDVDVKKRFTNELAQKIWTLIFLLFGAGVSVLLLYRAFAYSYDLEVWSLIFGLIFFAVFVPYLFHFVKQFLQVSLVAVGDKGVVTYTLFPNAKLKDHQIILWSHDMELKTINTNIYGRSRLLPPLYTKTEYKWHQGEKVVEAFEYDSRVKPRDIDKEIAESVKRSFEVYRITRKHS